LKGLYKVSARRANKIITSEVYGNIAEKETLFNRLMSRHKIPHSRRHEWKLQETKLNKQIND